MSLRFNPTTSKLDLINTISNSVPKIQRNLASDLRLLDGESLVIQDYLSLTVGNLQLDGDSTIYLEGQSL